MVLICCLKKKSIGGIMLDRGLRLMVHLLLKLFSRENSWENIS